MSMTIKLSNKYETNSQVNGSFHGSYQEDVITVFITNIMKYSNLNPPVTSKA